MLPTPRPTPRPRFRPIFPARRHAGRGRALALVAVVLAVLVAVSAVVVAPVSAVGSEVEAGATTTTVADLPGTTLEAQERDDGTTSPAPWLIGSALAAAVSIGLGGMVLKRYQR